MKHKILHADDQENLRRVFKMLLKYDFPEFEIESFENGSSLEERLNGDLEGVKLVVTDNDMHPGISGSKVIMDYAQRPGFTHLPFILFYGGDASVGELAKQHGAFAYVMKGTDPKELIVKIKEALNYSEITQLSQ